MSVAPRWVLIANLGIVSVVLSAPPPPGPAPAVVKGIREEVLRGNADPIGRPLPLAASWNVRYWEPDYQVEMIRAGHHVLPWVGHPNPKHASDEARQRYLEFNGRALRAWAAWKMPLTVRDHNYAMGLNKTPYSKLPPDKSPLTVRHDGTIWKRPSPIGAVGPWREVGKALTDTPVLRAVQEIYPDPPRVMFLSNNETRKLRWHELKESKRFEGKYGKDMTGAARRELVCQGWVKRFGELLGGMRDGLAAPAWKKNAFFVAYNAFGPCHYGRWSAWKQYSVCTPERIAPWPMIWDGGSPSYYDNDWERSKADYLVWSPQVEAMNWVFMAREAYELNPDFWFEVSVWDGNHDWAAHKTEGRNPKSKPTMYVKKGQSYTPARYLGRVQFCLWLVRPRLLREFRGSTQLREKYQPMWDVILTSVDRVWANDTLKRFWRKGRLVPNRRRNHPWQANLLAKYKGADRWFLLDTSLDAPGEWTNSTKIEVFSLARVLGAKPKRQWLVYAHAPLGDKRAAGLTVPEFGKITVDVPVGGAFWVVSEADKSVREVGFPSPR